MALKHLLLFDIDGTLLRCGRQVGSIFESALKRTYGGYQRPEGYTFAGKTDPMIVLEMVAAIGLEPERIYSLLPEMRRSYADQLDAELDVSQMRLLPGVVELLQQLKERDDLLLGLLTGNWQRGAEVKLGRFGLNRYFEVGAFGGDAQDRRGLVPVALDRAAQTTGHRFAPEDCLILGDTVLDVDCAQAHGVPCLAVTTGFTDASVLEAAGADWVFEDLVAAGRGHDLLAGK